MVVLPVFCDVRPTFKLQDFSFITGFPAMKEAH